MKSVQSIGKISQVTASEYPISITREGCFECNLNQNDLGAYVELFVSRDQTLAAL